MRRRDDSSPPVSCTHLLTVWLVSAASVVSLSRVWAGPTNPRESLVCEEALTSGADCLRTHTGLEPVGRTPKSAPLANGSRSHELIIIQVSRSYELADLRWPLRSRSDELRPWGSNSRSVLSV